ncbi:hypothetical protein SKAU_G00322520 [Synaphobranchus kaupii]|uniref:Uncharacterized protein n=1 Tax=Synaphobranchus kaupii TaxID=118154 RepID=A0A9Q1EP24_SYNKA|nr:hypothetical protein SKAU_G00322520 [Synaphobranchus kaupii]
MHPGDRRGGVKSELPVRRSDAAQARRRKAVALGVTDKGSERFRKSNRSLSRSRLPGCPAWTPSSIPGPRHLHRYCNQHFKRDQVPSKEQ